MFSLTSILCLDNRTTRSETSTKTQCISDKEIVFSAKEISYPRKILDSSIPENKYPCKFLKRPFAKNGH